MGWLDARDVFYVVAGLAFLGFMVLPVLRTPRWVNVPTVYVVLGMGLAWAGMPVIDPRAEDLSRLVVEHVAELIVIVSIAGAGLAVDRPMGARAWHHTWVLLGVTMPLTIAAVAGASWWWAGLPVATAVLVGACLAPTDPVLARSVQVKGPGEGEDHDEPIDVRHSLTTEAGLNDALAFPFVHLAIALAALAVGGAAAQEAAPAGPWWAWWLGFDVAYRLAGAVAVGWLVGHLMARWIYSRLGDARRGGENAGLVLLAGTFLSYGLAESVEAYGFLSVFVCARAGRAFARGKQEHEGYARLPHRFSDQFEKLLLSLLLLWLGGLSVSGLLAGWRWGELAVAVALVGVIRPLAGWLALLPTEGSRLDRFAIAALGIRGLGSIFYLAYGLGHGAFPGGDAAWRITVFTILLSIAVHGVAARVLMERLEGRGDAGGPEG